MDCDIPKWLKDDLGLIHMSEADLSGLMFHPRHGNLCRRLIKFLTESTMCSRKYPNVYAREHYVEAMAEIERKRDHLRDSVKNLETYVKGSENEERELGFLKLRFDHLRGIEDLHRTSTEALETIANRPNIGIEQVTRNLEKLDYLSNSDLADIYSTDKSVKFDATVSARQIASLDEELNDLMRKICVLHEAISEMLQEMTDKMDIWKMDEDLQLRNTDIQNLVALRVPEPEEMTVNNEPDEKALNDINNELNDKVSRLNQQITELKHLYTSRKADIIRSRKGELEQCLHNLNKLEELENFIREGNSLR